MEIYITKGELIELLGEDAIKFYGYMQNQDEQAIAIKNMYNDLTKININSVTIKNYLIPILLSVGVISKNTVDRINAFIASKQV